jgi:hypothetical protein
MTMDERAFGEPSKRVAAVDSRRGIAGLLGAAVLGLSLAARGATGVEAAFGYCSPPGTKCSKDKKCCVGKCKGGACGCNGKGAPCLNRIGVACCSQTCRKGKCA